MIAAGGALLALGDAIAARRPTAHSAPLAWRREGDDLYISDALLGGWMTKLAVVWAGSL